LLRRLSTWGHFVDPASETFSFDNNIPSPPANNNGADLHFDEDGYLYARRELLGDGIDDGLRPAICRRDQADLRVRARQRPLSQNLALPEVRGILRIGNKVNRMLRHLDGFRAALTQLHLAALLGGRRPVCTVRTTDPSYTLTADDFR
jgi:hypothetical protein